ncbi:site-specific integrase [Micromonospora sp. WMMD718]|uniref:tyrosine-type recombinase/integrase n=1 Tax=Micromonospora sp. WMMD718 TaxID=3016098 RepID=UPI002415D0E2|nr:site-specific integrase [Micromonospora sp. WMMD718]MDG4749348.1 site-specific integrase [Micromonospora sp. WMMD718]
MPVDDLWYLTKRGPNDERLRSARYGRGKRWRVRYIDDEGKPKALLFERKADADAHDARMRADVSRGVYVDPTAGKVTVANYFAEWRKLQLHADSTEIKTEWAHRLHIAPTPLGRMAIAQARRSHVQAWVLDRAKVLEPSSLHPVYAYLAGMFRAAVLDRVIGHSPCQGITLPELVVAKRYIATTDEVHALADGFAPAGRPYAQGAHYRAQVYVAAGAGLRQGEIWGLELEHVDFLRRRIHVVQQLKVISGRKPFLAPPKTSTSVRDLDLADVAAEALAAHLERFPIREVEVDDLTDPRRPRTRKAKLIFLNADGKPIHRGSFSKPWRRAVTRAGLPEDYTMHALRHYFATLLIAAGASVTTVQLALGHANPSITLNRYAGLWPEATEQVRTLVDAALKRPDGRRPAAAR